MGRDKEDTRHKKMLKMDQTSAKKSNICEYLLYIVQCFASPKI